MQKDAVMTKKDLAKKLEELLRLDTRPVAVKLYENKEDAPRRPLNFKLNFCQLVAMARYQGKANVGTPERMICAMGAACLGLINTPDSFTSGKAAVGAYCKDAEVGKKFMANTFKLGDTGKKYDAVMVEPLESSSEEADVVVIYGNPAQMMRLIHANAYETGEKVSADTVAEAALCSSIGYVVATGKCALGLPCAGDRIFGGTQPSEAVFVLPAADIDRIVKNLELTAEGGFSVYPVPPNMNWTPAMPDTYTVHESDL